MIKQYTNGELTVYWEPEKCRHAMECVSGCPEVFNVNNRPWIDMSGADTKKIYDTVKKCPTGALTCELVKRQADN